MFEADCRPNSIDEGKEIWKYHRANHFVPFSLGILAHQEFGPVEAGIEGNYASNLGKRLVDAGPKGINPRGGKEVDDWTNLLAQLV